MPHPRLHHPSLRRIPLHYLFNRAYFRHFEVSLKGPQVIEFLKHLQRHLPGRLPIIWDGATIHRSKLVREYIASLRGKLWVERLSAYAPELNPVEYLWGHITQHELANLCPKDLQELSGAAVKALFKVKRTKSYIRAFWIQSELPF